MTTNKTNGSTGDHENDEGFHIYTCCSDPADVPARDCTGPGERRSRIGRASGPADQHTLVPGNARGRAAKYSSHRPGNGGYACRKLRTGRYEPDAKQLPGKVESSKRRHGLS